MNALKLIITIVFIFITNLIFGQSFEGTLVYKINYQIEIPKQLEKMGVTKEILIEKMKKEGTWADSIKTTYKNGNYLTSTNSTPQTWSIYKPETNKLYSFQNGDASDICTVTDASIDLEFEMTGNKPIIAKLDTSAMINGVTCEAVRVKWRTGTYDYYYNNSTLKVDPKLFENHIYDGWADFLKISKALPICIMKSTKGFGKVTFTLVSQKCETIKENLFQIPQLVPDKDLNIVKIGNRELMRIKK